MADEVPQANRDVFAFVRVRFALTLGSAVTFRIAPV